jgi:hypothetical protein
MDTAELAGVDTDDSETGGGNRWVGPVAVAVIVAFATGLFGFYWGNQDRSDFEEQVLRANPLIDAAAADTLVRVEGSSGAVSAILLLAPGVREAYLRAEGFPALAGNDVYQGWFSKDGTIFEPSSAFKETDAGAWLWAAEPVENYAAVAFTVEDERGRREMTNEPFLVVEF